MAKPTKQQVAQAKARAGGNNPIKVTDAGLKKLGKVALEAAMIAAPGGAGAKIGTVAGKALLRSIAKDARPAAIKAANKARGSGKMVNPKAPSGDKVKTAPKRDVVVKTEDKTLAVKDRFINRKGEKSVKVNTNKPTVRTINKGTSQKEANKQTASFNKMRYGASKKEADRGSAAVQGTKSVPNAGKKIGKTLGATAGAAGASAKNKKSK
jgi:hypothetical protein